MASLAMPLRSFNLGLPLSSPAATRPCRRAVQLPRFSKVTEAFRLSSTHCISGFSPLRPQKLCTLSPPAPRNQPFSIFAAKGYKMKTHKASAKRFRVTGRGKIVRRRAGKQHLLAKKNTKRKLRLSKMHPVSRSDYNNVIGALPYLKVDRNAK